MTPRIRITGVEKSCEQSVSVTESNKIKEQEDTLTWYLLKMPPLGSVQIPDAKVPSTSTWRLNSDRDEAEGVMRTLC